MRLVLGHDIAVAGWVGERIGAPMTPPYTALGFLDRHERLAAGFVFYGYVPGGNVDLAVAVNGRLDRGAIAAVASYAFEQLKASRITCRPPAGHDRAIDILKRVGFRAEAICKRFYGDRDAVQLRILKTEAKRWHP